MLYDLSEQVAHCYRRAAECKERSGHSANLSDKAFYLEREGAWLTLARSFEFSERVGRVLKERQTQRLRNWPATSRVPDCPACHVEMRLHAIEPLVVQATKIVFERAYVLCANCGRLDNYLCD